MFGLRAQRLWLRLANHVAVSLSESTMPLCALSETHVSREIGYCVRNYHPNTNSSYLRLPKRTILPPLTVAEKTTPEAETSSSPADQSHQQNMQAAAQAATAWMFPWERRQLDGGKLRTWEKVYWIVFVGGLAVYLALRLARGQQKEEEVDEELEARKRELIRLALAGRKTFAEDEDPFDGLTPQEIQAYVEKEKELAGISDDDPFEGMSPEEINEYLAKHGQPG